MLSGLFDLVKNFFDAISSIITLVVNLITSLVHFIVMIPTYMSQLLTTVGLLPAFLLPFAVACITISVFQYVLNRKGG